MERTRGFSLVEVVIAVGILAVAITGVLALLPLLTRHQTDASDSLVAQRLSGAVEAELRRLSHGSSLSGLASSIKVVGDTNTLTLVARRDGSGVREESVSTLDDAERFFAIELWQFPSAPLAYEAASGAVLLAQAKVSWPYKQRSQEGDAVRTDPADRSGISFTVAISR